MSKTYWSSLVAVSGTGCSEKSQWRDLDIQHYNIATQTTVNHTVDQILLSRFVTSVNKVTENVAIL